MADLILPPWARVSSQRLTHSSSTGSNESIFTSAVRTTNRVGDRVRFGLSTRNASERESGPTRALLSSLAGELRGQSNRLYFTDPSYRKRGSFPTFELLANSEWASGTTSWTTSSANIVLTANDRILRSKRASVSGDETIRAAVATTVSGATYIARAMALAGRGPMDFRLRLGTSAGGTELAADSTDNTAQGLRTLVAAATGTTTHFSIVDGITGRSIGHYMDFAYVSLSRCALVSGASQTGGGIVIDQLPASTNGLARQSDWCQIGNQLCKITAALDSDSSGVGFLQLAYPPRVTPADNAPVIFHQPMGRFAAMSPEHAREDSPGGFSNFELEICEDLSA